MALMSVTPEVSQPEMSALNAAKTVKSPLMSVIAETSQPEMGPYVAAAETALASNATTANFRAAYSVKVDWQWWLEWWLALLHAHVWFCAMVGHSGRHWLYQSCCWKQLLGQQHAPCETPPRTHAPSRPMHVVLGGDGGGAGACAARATESSNAADHGGIGTLRLRTSGSSLHTMGGRVERRGHSTKGAWCASRLPLRGPAAAVEAPFRCQRSYSSPHPLHRRTARQTFPTAGRRRQITSTGRKGGAHREPRPVGVDVGVGRGKFPRSSTYSLLLALTNCAKGKTRNGVVVPTLGPREETRYENQEGFTRTATSNNCVTRDINRLKIRKKLPRSQAVRLSRCPPVK